MKARDYVPALKYGAKIYPEDLAGMIGQPAVGNIWYVDANAGSDTANAGTSLTNAFATLGQAHTAAVDYNYDVIVVAPTANSVTTEASITFSKSYITVVGATAPIPTAQRARIGFGSSATTPCLKISGLSNRFINLKLVVEQNVAVLVEVATNKQYFQNVDFAGICNATTGAASAARCVVLDDGASENYFGNCTFGVDTVLRSTNNATLEIQGTSSNARNLFENCLFTIVTSSAGTRHVLFTGNYAAECYQWFKNCLFLNTRGDTTTMTVGMTIPVSVNGTVILDGCAIKGATDWSSDYTNLYGCNNPKITASNSGFLEQITT